MTFLKSLPRVSLVGAVLISFVSAEIPATYAVSGKMDTKSLGLVLAHEHVLVDFVGADQVSPERYDRSEVVAKMLPFVQAARAAGVDTMVECTPNYIGRDPVVLRMLSERTGMQFITNTGLYGAVQDKFLPPYAFKETAAQLAARWTGEFRHGIADTGIKPGFIKSAVDRDTVLSEVDEKLIHAAALTHLATGLTIAVHTGPGPGLTQLNILAEHGVDPSAWIWVHAQAATHADVLEAAKRGAWISLDGFRERSLDRHLERLLMLRAAGFLDQVLISHDAGWFDPAKPAGGEPRGYTYLFDAVIPRLMEEGFSDGEIQKILRRNPARALAISVRQVED
ncbi:MAG: aryldialkylphosphatase [Synoicihabitans sp.]